MSVVTVRPDNTITVGEAGNAPHPGGTMDSVTSDGNDDGTGTADSTYATVEGAGSSAGAPMVLGFEEPTGGPFVRVALRVRVARTSAGTVVIEYKTVGGSAPRTVRHNIFWPSPVTYEVAKFNIEAFDIADVKLSVGRVTPVGVTVLNVYELYLDFITVDQPVANVFAPSGEITDTNLPTIQWTNTLDPDGGEQTHYEVKIFKATVEDDLDFDPDSSLEVLGSGILSGNNLSHRFDNNKLDDNDYFAFVRVGQMVNGEIYWSVWSSKAFTISVGSPPQPGIPDIPTVALVPDGGGFRILVAATDPGTGPVQAGQFQVQSSADNESTWVNVRTYIGNGLVPATGDDPNTVMVADYESPNGADIVYRVRGIYNKLVYTDWAYETARWDNESWCIKSPTQPDLNLAINPRGQPSKHKAMRQGVFFPAGSSRPVVVSDKPESWTGELLVRIDSDADRVALQALIDSASVLLVQAPADVYDWPDTWIVATEYRRERAVDVSWAKWTFDGIPWMEVDRP